MALLSQVPAQSRSAHAAIKGYEYQFDRTVLSILAASATSFVDIEGIEDIDLIGADASQATQVKYFEGQRYSSPKSLRDPVRLMLEHYRTGARWAYVLHVHFGDSGDLPSVFSVEQLKACLTKRDQTSGEDVEYFSGLDDLALKDFCGRLSIRNGETFEDQQAELVRALSGALACSEDEVHAIYLAKARDFVHEHARSADSQVRRVSRAQILASLSVQELLFSRWQLAALGRERYLRIQVAHLKRSGFTDTKRVRGVWIELSDENFSTAVGIAKDAASSHIGRLKSAKPWVFILRGPSELLLKFKVELVRGAIPFNDGCEEIEFSADAFNRPPIVNLIGTSDKLKSSSFVLRTISEANFQSQLTESSKLGRLIVLGEKSDWHDTVAEDVYVLKDYEPGLLRTLMGEVA